MTNIDKNGMVNGSKQNAKSMPKIKLKINMLDLLAGITSNKLIIFLALVP